MSEITQALFVAWQQPKTRRFYPVARLAHATDEDCQQCYEFAYIHGAREAEEHGFRPFLSFPDLEQVYRSPELFPLFSNRLLPASRMEYPQYIERLGLVPDKANALTVLGRSGGGRATDTVELFPIPSYDPEFESYATVFLAHSIRDLPPASHERIGRLQFGDPLFPMLDFKSEHNPAAIALRTEDQMIVGYMPSYLVDDARHLQMHCELFEVFVEKVNPHPAPMSERLLCRLESCWPPDFMPFAADRYQPLPAEAAKIRAPAVSASVA